MATARHNLLLFALLAIAVSFRTANAFGVVTSPTTTTSTSKSIPILLHKARRTSKSTRKWAQEENSSSDSDSDTSSSSEPTPSLDDSLDATIERLRQKAFAPKAQLEEQEDAEPPLNVPSPILLSSSMVLAIASIGSVFEIIEGKVTSVSIGIALIGFPLFLFLFYAALLKGAAETKEDDENYLNGR
mmetsp:Transcript_22072/g.28564  ORF Transcript_22072/g.28564 Transcript_22072/m.28564 type:complete len:187 (+) Transcript_22072:120-680(+)|eukprot:CAMPEP_0198143824 /NCGR_PEP_ID=MMETSP1443-20131203/10573_1 /TAXON_ID=186043 /ORGANISM="Entomoneis sp., Strain CCMP2396" /LENGTH=186 /DNA_ID=CAMNT_0043807111 /DNA_START=62 /DNA_END=622 /DNA_ORIENTATION=+